MRNAIVNVSARRRPRTLRQDLVAHPVQNNGCIEGKATMPQPWCSVFPRGKVAGSRAARW